MGFFIIKLFRALKMLISNVTKVYALHVFGYTILFVSNQYFLGVLFLWAQFGNPEKITAKTSCSSEISLLSNKALIVRNKSNKVNSERSQGGWFSEYFGAKRNLRNHLMISPHPTFYLKQQITLTKSYAEH